MTSTIETLGNQYYKLNFVKNFQNSRHSELIVKYILGQKRNATMYEFLNCTS